MIDCLVLGDSIALGFGQVRPDCTSISVSSITTNNWLLTKSSQIQPANTTIISLGTNDWNFETLEPDLERVRSTLSGRIFWILPSATLRPQQRAIVEKVAKSHGDLVLNPPKSLEADGIHPTYTGGYQELGTLAR